MRHLGNDAVQVDHVKEMHDDLNVLKISMHTSLEDNSQLVETAIDKINVVAMLTTINTAVLLGNFGALMYYITNHGA